MPIKRSQDRYHYGLWLSLVSWVGISWIFLKDIATKIQDPDLWWHLALGREMVGQGQIIQSDIFSHTMFGAEWINFEWLSQLIIYGVNHHFGIQGIYVGKIVLGLTCLLLLALLVYMAGMRNPWAVILVWFGFEILRPRLMERPELATLIFLPFTVGLLLAGRKGLIRPISTIPWILFGLMILWVNMHGGFLYGVGTVVLFLIGALWAREPKAYTQILWRSTYLVGLGMLISPYHVKIFKVFIAHMNQYSFGTPLVQEWISPSIQSAPFFWILFVLAVCALGAGVLAKVECVKFWIPAIFVFGIWGCQHFRNTALFPFFALPFLIEIGKAILKNFSILKSSTLQIGGWFLCVLIIITGVKKTIHSFPSSLVAQSRFPIQACQFVSDQKLKGNMFNTYGFGGYIDWALGPEVKIFMDGRFIFYPKLEEYNALLSYLAQNPPRNEWAPYFSSHDINYAIVNYHPFLKFMFPRRDWALIFWDDAALVFIKRKAKNEFVIREFAYAHLYPYDFEEMKYGLAQGILSKDTLRQELLRHEQRINFSIVRNELAHILKITEKGQL